MSEHAKKAMNDMTIYEARTIYATNKKVSIIGNGQLVEIVDETKAAEAEERRCKNGY